MKKLQGDFVLIFAGRALQALHALISVRLTTTLLGPAEIGRMNLVLSVTSWFTLLLISPVGNYIFRQAVEWNMEGRLLQSLRRFAVFLGLVAATAGITLTVVQSTVGIGTPIELGWLLWLIAASLVLATLNGTFTSLLNTLGFRAWFVLLANLTTWLGLGAAIGLTSWFGRQAEYWLNGLLIAQTAVALLAGALIYRVLRRPSQAVAKSAATAGFDIRSVFGFSWPLIVSTGFYWAQINGYRFVLVGLTNVATIGLFTTGLAIAISPMTMFDMLFTEYYRPIFYRDIAYGDMKQKAQAWNRYASAYFPAIIVMGTFIAASGPLLARILVSEEFQQVSWLAFWGALVQATLMFYATYVSLAFASLDTRVLIRPNILGAVIAIAGTLVLARWQPFLGTAISLFSGMVVTMLATAFRLGHDFPLRLPWRRLALAGLLSLPLFVGLEEAKRFWPVPNLSQTVVLLAGAGLYMVATQFVLAREWMFQTSNALISTGLPVKTHTDTI